MLNRPIVIFDACVLYPATLRNVLLQLAGTGLFRARWTTRIRREWTRALRADKPDLSPERMSRLARLVDAAVPDCIVTGYEPLVDGLTLPDPADRHVLAAAIRCRADVILTTNLRDFPTARLSPFSVTAAHPDDFVANLLDLDASTVRHAVETVRARLKRPPYSTSEFHDLLERRGLARTAAILRRGSASL